MNNKIDLDSALIEEINTDIEKAKKGVELKAYTEAGGKAREACEFFTKMILNAFLDNTVNGKYITLNDQLKLIKDRKCLESKEVEILYGIKEYGNSAVHSDKNPDFNPEAISKLLPAFEKIVQKYISDIDKQYEKYIERSKSGEANAFRKIDNYLKIALETYVENWTNCFNDCINVKSDNDTLKMYYLYSRIYLPENKISYEDKLKIRENLYSATKDYMGILCRINQINVFGDDYTKILTELSKYNANSGKLGYSKSSFYYESTILKSQIIPDDIETDDSYAKSSYSNFAFGIIEDDFCGKIVQLYDIDSYRLPYKLKNTNNQLDLSAFFEIRKICEGALVGTDSWDSEIYGYIRLIHQAVESTKKTFGGKYNANPLDDLIGKMDNCILAIEEKAYAETKEEFAKHEIKWQQNAKESAKQVEINKWKDELSSIKGRIEQRQEKIKENEGNQNMAKLKLILCVGAFVFITYLNSLIFSTVTLIFLAPIVLYSIYQFKYLSILSKEDIKLEEEIRELQSKYNNNRKLVVKNNNVIK